MNQPLSTKRLPCIIPECTCRLIAATYIHIGFSTHLVLSDSVIQPLFRVLLPLRKFAFRLFGRFLYYTTPHDLRCWCHRYMFMSQPASQPTAPIPGRCCFTMAQNRLSPQYICPPDPHSWKVYNRLHTVSRGIYKPSPLSHVESIGISGK